MLVGWTSAVTLTFGACEPELPKVTLSQSKNFWSAAPDQLGLLLMSQLLLAPSPTQVRSAAEPVPVWSTMLPGVVDGSTIDRPLRTVGRTRFETLPPSVPA